MAERELMKEGLTERQQEALDLLYRTLMRAVTFVISLWVLSQLQMISLPERQAVSQVLVIAIIVWSVADVARMALYSGGRSFGLFVSEGVALYRQYRREKGMVRGREA